ncbi:hypothetical protein ADUPG1_009504, partial [Aduncisulcus paluster]
MSHFSDSSETSFKTCDELSDVTIVYSCDEYFPVDVDTLEDSNDDFFNNPFYLEHMKLSPVTSPEYDLLSIMDKLPEFVIAALLRISSRYYSLSVNGTFLSHNLPKSCTFSVESMIQDDKAIQDHPTGYEETEDVYKDGFKDHIGENLSAIAPKHACSSFSAQSPILLSPSNSLPAPCFLFTLMTLNNPQKYPFEKLVRSLLHQCCFVSSKSSQKDVYNVREILGQTDIDFGVIINDVCEVILGLFLVHGGYIGSHGHSYRTETSIHHSFFVSAINVFFSLFPIYSSIQTLTDACIASKQRVTSTNIEFVLSVLASYAIFEDLSSKDHTYQSDNNNKEDSQLGIIIEFIETILGYNEKQKEDDQVKDEKEEEEEEEEGWKDESLSESKEEKEEEEGKEIAIEESSISAKLKTTIIKPVSMKFKIFLRKLMAIYRSRPYLDSISTISTFSELINNGLRGAINSCLRKMSSSLGLSFLPLSLSSPHVSPSHLSLHELFLESESPLSVIDDETESCLSSPHVSPSHLSLHELFLESESPLSVIDDETESWSSEDSEEYESTSDSFSSESLRRKPINSLSKEEDGRRRKESKKRAKKRQQKVLTFVDRLNELDRFIYRNDQIESSYSSSCKKTGDSFLNYNDELRAFYVCQSIFFRIWKQEYESSTFLDDSPGKSDHSMRVSDRYIILHDEPEQRRRAEIESDPGYYHINSVHYHQIRSSIWGFPCDGIKSKETLSKGEENNSVTIPAIFSLAEKVLNLSSQATQPRPSSIVSNSDEHGLISDEYECFIMNIAFPNVVLFHEKHIEEKKIEEKTRDVILNNTNSDQDVDKSLSIAQYISSELQRLTQPEAGALKPREDIRCHIFNSALSPQLFSLLMEAFMKNDQQESESRIFIHSMCILVSYILSVKTLQQQTLSKEIESNNSMPLVRTCKYIFSLIMNDTSKMGNNIYIPYLVDYYSNNIRDKLISLSSDAGMTHHYKYLLDSVDVATMSWFYSHLIPHFPLDFSLSDVFQRLNIPHSFSSFSLSLPKSLFILVDSRGKGKDVVSRLREQGLQRSESCGRFDESSCLLSALLILCDRGREMIVDSLKCFFAHQPCEESPSRSVDEFYNAGRLMISESLLRVFVDYLCDFILHIPNNSHIYTYNASVWLSRAIISKGIHQELHQGEDEEKEDGQNALMDIVRYIVEFIVERMTATNDQETLLLWKMVKICKISKFERYLCIEHVILDTHSFLPPSSLYALDSPEHSSDLISIILSHNNTVTSSQLSASQRSIDGAGQELEEEEDSYSSSSSSSIHLMNIPSISKGGIGVGSAIGTAASNINQYGVSSDSNSKNSSNISVLFGALSYSDICLFNSSLMHPLTLSMLHSHICEHIINLVKNSSTCSSDYASTKSLDFQQHPSVTHVVARSSSGSVFFPRELPSSFSDTTSLSSSFSFDSIFGSESNKNQDRMSLSYSQKRRQALCKNVDTLLKRCFALCSSSFSSPSPDSTMLSHLYSSIQLIYKGVVAQHPCKPVCRVPQLYNSEKEREMVKNMVVLGGIGIAQVVQVLDHSLWSSDMVFSTSQSQNILSLSKLKWISGDESASCEYNRKRLGRRMHKSASFAEWTWKKGAKEMKDEEEEEEEEGEEEEMGHESCVFDFNFNTCSFPLSNAINSTIRNIITKNNQLLFLPIEPEKMYSYIKTHSLLESLLHTSFLFTSLCYSDVH